MTANRPIAPATTPGRRRMLGALAAVGSAAALTGIATPATAQSQGPTDESTARTSPRQLMAGFYATYNGDLAAGFERYISKDLVLHGFDGPNSRDAWVAGDLELKSALSGFRMDVFDQLVEGNKVVTRWRLGGVHTGAILGIPPSGLEVSLTGISIDRVVGRQSVEHWSEGNFGRFLDTIRGKSA
ncbi:ester cyclase [Streptomyces sp. NPDC047453]|uniref:ester cyclase n=1 Tax=Streptomyces sp. NPDC047453 TaxID=3154812 RepID=UPI00340BD9B5